MQVLVSAQEVKNSFAHFLVLEASFRLADPAEGARLFAKEHVKGAQFVDLNQDLSSPKTGLNGRHPWPTRTQLAALFSRLGISADQPVLCYDDADHSGAGRLWAALRWMGHANAFVLNGGLPAAKAAGLPLESGAPQAHAAAQFPDRPSLLSLYGKEELSGESLWDARAPERYRGEVEPLDPKAGHIPGAQNLFYKTLLQADGSFLPAAELRARLPKGNPVFYCGSGVTGTVPLLAAESVGQAAGLYAGSWSEWSQQPNAPVAHGENP